MAAAPPSNTLRSPRRPITNDDKHANLTDKITGPNRVIINTESSRISRQNELRRSCIVSHAVPMYSSFSKDNMSYHLTTQFDQQGGRWDDSDTRFKMFRSQVKHSEAFELAPREKHRMDLLNEIGILSTIRNVDVSFDEALPKISPRQTTNNNSNSKEGDSPSNNNSKKLSSKKGQTTPRSRRNDAHPLTSTDGVTTTTTSSWAPAVEDLGEGEAFAVSTFDPSANAATGTRPAPLLTFAEDARGSSSVDGGGGGGGGDIMPAIITPRADNPRNRIVGHLRTREVLLNELGHSQSTLRNQYSNVPLRGTTGAAAVPQQGSGGAPNNINNNVTTSASHQYFHIPSPPTAASMVANVSSPSYTNNITNAQDGGGSGAAAVGTDAGPINNLLAMSPSIASVNQNRRVSQAVPLIVGGSEQLTEAAKEMAKKKPMPPTGHGHHHHHRHHHHRRHGAKHQQQGKVGLLSQRGDHQRRKRGELLDDTINSNPSETYNDIPLFEVDSGAEDGVGSGSNSRSGSSSSSSSGRSSRSSSTQQKHKSPLSQSTTGGKGGGGGSSMTFDNAPVAVAKRTFHLKMAPGTPLRNTTTNINESAAFEEVFGPAFAKDKKNRDTNNNNNLLSATLSSTLDGTQQRLLNRTGALASGINFEIPALTLTMPAPQRGVGGGSMLTLREQLARGAAGHTEPPTNANTATTATTTSNNASASPQSKQQPTTHNWCLPTAKPDAPRSSETYAAVSAALSTPRGLKDLFAPVPYTSASASLLQQQQLGGHVGSMSPGSMTAQRSKATSFYSTVTPSLFNLKRHAPSFAGFGGGGGGRSSANLGTTRGTDGNSTAFDDTTAGTPSWNDYYYGEGGAGGGLTANGLFNPPVDSALTHVVPPVVFKGLTSSGAGNPQLPRRKRTMNVNYGGQEVPKVSPRGARADGSLSARI